MREVGREHGMGREALGEGKNMIKVCCMKRIKLKHLKKNT